MKLKLNTKKTKKKADKPAPKKKPTGESLGSLEELQSKAFLEKIRKKHKKDDAIENYCDMLETQINSLVDKLLPTHQELVDLTRDHENLKSYMKSVSSDLAKLQREIDENVK